jgi:1-aminocyclopropane-1-carboxylate deaminase/D-cysteine desulfhydrase-like pyridoxal-dependent ACC family enzyme
LHQLAKASQFRPGERVVAVHTGGLQGARGFYE